MKLYQKLFLLAVILLLAACRGANQTGSATPALETGAQSTDSEVAPTAEPASPTSAPAAETIEVEAQAAGVKLICSTGEPFDVCAGGPRVVKGQASSGNFTATPDLFPNPTVVLIDITNVLNKEPEFVPDSGLIFGYFTEPLFPGPGEVRVNLPITPSGASLDLDNNGQQDAGVQMYALLVTANLISDSYLQQLEQVSGLTSYIRDITDGGVTQGTFLIYAPDGEQSFPAAVGEDGQWFSGDEPVITLPAGYTAATLNADGTVMLDRSSEIVMNTLERAEQVSPNFSDQGILESFNSLIDTLKVRYAYTELRSLDWEAIRAQYIPQVEQADANQDFASYYLALKDMGQSINDGHVAAITTNLEASLADVSRLAGQTGGALGASTFAVIDENTPLESIGDRIVVLTVGEGTPAQEAGWIPGTEIVSINGEPAPAWLDRVPLPKSFGTEASRRATQAKSILKFPSGETVTIGYRLPDSDEVLTATMVAGDYSDGSISPPAGDSTPISYEEIGGYAVLRWSSFMDNLLLKIAVLEEALWIEQQRSSGGVILDLRSNSGGLDELYETMVSYFFTADDPMKLKIFDWYRYDEQTGGHVLTYMTDYVLSSPRPDLAYTGPVVVLVDELCASACEYFSQHLQVLERAVVIGQYPSDGAGGFIDRIKLPGEITFQFTQGGTYFAGTDEPNLEAKGVIPDILVPVTLETEMAKMRGEDPVMQAAVAYLDSKAGETSLVGTTWQWSATMDTSGAQTPVESPSSYTLVFSEDSTVAIAADCNQATGGYTVDEDGLMAITVGPSSLAACPEGSLSETFLDYLGSIVNYGFEGEQLVIVVSSDGANLLLLFDPSK